MLNEPHNLLSERAAPAITRGVIFAEISMSSLYGTLVDRGLSARGARISFKYISASRSRPFAAPIIVYYINVNSSCFTTARRAIVELIKRSDRMQIRSVPELRFGTTRPRCLPGCILFVYASAYVPDGYPIFICGELNV